LQFANFDGSAMVINNESNNNNKKIWKDF